MKVSRFGVLLPGLLLFALTLPNGSSFGKIPKEVALSKSLEIELSQEGCDIFDDSQGIPHVRTPDEETAIACWGFIHARDRIWQMDYFRKTSQGRRAEILGSGEIKSDFIMRILGLHERAQEIYSKLTPVQQRTLLAYSLGVNRFIQLSRSKDYQEAYEFKKLGYAPEPWTPADTLALALLQSFDQTRKTLGTQLQEHDWSAQYGNVLNLIESDGLPWDISILKKGEYPVRSTVSAGYSVAPQKTDFWSASAVRDLRDLLLQNTSAEIGVGSNNWVLAPAHSESGYAWLANDPHLKLHYPAVWHLAHIQGGRLDAIGAAFPGIPAVVSGANRNVSWGLTNAYLNVSSVALVNESEVKDAVQTRPIIWFRLGFLKIPFFFKTFQKVSGAFPVLPVPAPAGKVFVLNWSGFDVNSELMGETFDGLQALLVADSAQKADLALQKMHLPTWNFVFADIHGKTGFRSVGRIPRNSGVRPLGISGYPLADWLILEKEKKWFSPQEMPHVFDPQRGYIVTANNRQWPADAAFHGGRSYQAGFRAFRIEELLKKTAKHDFDSLRKIQCDVQATDARFLVPLLLSAVTEGRELAIPEQQAVSVLRSWDFEASLECRACALYRRWMDRVKQESKLNESAIYRKLQRSDSALVELVARQLTGAIMDLKSTAGSIEPSWESVHVNRFPHLLDENWFGNEMIPTPGDDHTVNPGSADWENGRFFHKIGASERLLVEMRNPPIVYSVLPGTNSDFEKRALSDPASPWVAWASCRLEKRLFPLDWANVPFRKIVFR